MERFKKAANLINELGMLNDEPGTTNDNERLSLLDELYDITPGLFDNLPISIVIQRNRNLGIYRLTFRIYFTKSVYMAFETPDIFYDRKLTGQTLMRFCNCAKRDLYNKYKYFIEAKNGRCTKQEDIRDSGEAQQEVQNTDGQQCC